MKRLLSVILTLALLLSFATFQISAATVDTAQTSDRYYVSLSEFEDINVANGKVIGYLGDVDGDNEISVMDATAIQCAIAKLTTLSTTANLLADTDRDGEASVIDATAIQCFAAQLSTNTKVAHTLYVEYGEYNPKNNMFNQVVDYIKANTEYDEEFEWYYLPVTTNDSSRYTSLIYLPDEDTIAISGMDFGEEIDDPSTSIYISVERNSEEFIFLASREYTDSVYYSAYGNAKRTSLSALSYDMDCLDFYSDFDVSFSDVETSIKLNMDVAISDCNSALRGHINGYFENLFM